MKGIFLRCCWVQRQKQQSMSPSVAETRLSTLFSAWALTTLVLISRSWWVGEGLSLFPCHCHIWLLPDSSQRRANHRLLSNCSQYRCLRVVLLKWQPKKWRVPVFLLIPSTSLSSSQFQFQKKKVNETELINILPCCVTPALSAFSMLSSQTGYSFWIYSYVSLSDISITKISISCFLNLQLFMFV